MNQTCIPKQWHEVSLGDINNYQSKSVQPKNFLDETFELWSVPNFPTDKPEILSGQEIGSSKQAVAPQDVLICKINPRINRVWEVREVSEYRKIASSEWIVFRQPMVEPRFFRRFFQSSQFREKLCADVSGVGGSLTRAQPKKVATFSVPVPSLAEQKVIADKLDTLLAQVENTKARLERIPQILKRFRQSTLAAAVSGRLTEKWRNKHATNDEWQQVSLGDLVENGPQNGIYKPNNLYGSGCLIIRIDSFYDGLIAKWKDLKRVQVEPLEIQKWKVRQGDILINRVNSIEYLGKSALVPELIEPAIFESNIMRLSLIRDLAEPSFISLFLRSPVGLERLRANAKLAVNQASINQNDVKSCLLKLPKLAEQIEIVGRVDQLFTHFDRIEQQVNQALARVHNLTQSILAKAFRGELTEQWRKDNPELISGENSAEALLERIKAERAAKAPAQRSKRSA